MTDGIQTAIGGLSQATTSLIEWGVVGGVLVLSLMLNMLLGWLLYKGRSAQIDHLEAHYDNQI